MGYCSSVNKKVVQPRYSEFLRGFFVLRVGLEDLEERGRVGGKLERERRGRMREV